MSKLFLSPRFSENGAKRLAFDALLEPFYICAIPDITFKSQ